MESWATKTCLLCIYNSVSLKADNSFDSKYQYWKRHTWPETMQNLVEQWDKACASSLNIASAQ